MLPANPRERRVSKRTVGVKAEEPLWLLLARLQVYDGFGEVRSVNLLELFKHDLWLLAVGRVCGKEMKALHGGMWYQRKELWTTVLPYGASDFLTFAFFTSSGVASIYSELDIVD